MRRDTFREAIRRCNRQAPFRRYTVELVDGEHIIVYHPELIISQGDLIVYEEWDGTVTYFDASCVARVVNSVIPPGRH